MTCPDVKILAEADDIRSGVEMILAHRPELVFMDIHLRDGLSFEILENPDIQRGGHPDFHIIFLTAYNQYAIKAIRYSALDYLLKPIDPEELVNAIDRFKENRKTRTDHAQFELLFSQLKQEKAQPKKIVINAADKISIVKIDDIIRCESKDNYTLIFIRDSSPILVSRTLKEYEELLEPLGFLRIHQSHLVNINYIRTFIKADGGSVVMDNEDVVPVSYRKKDKLLEVLKGL